MSKACMVHPCELSGSCVAPPSKSYGIRGIAAALLAGGCTRIRPAYVSEDMQAALGIAVALGARVKHERTEICIESRGVLPQEDILFCGESALSMRLFAPLAALSAQPLVLQARGTLSRRLQTPFARLLPALGVAFEDQEGYPPLRVQGPLCPCDLHMDGTFSSQFLTGLLFAYAGAGAQGVSITLTHPVSMPYIALSLEVLRGFGVQVGVRDDSHFVFDEQAKLVSPGVFSVEGDWTAAAYLLVAAALMGRLLVKGLRLDSLQGDRYILEILSLAGAGLHLHKDAVEVHKAPLHAFRVSLSDRPDLFPAVAVLAAFAQGTSYLEGLDRLLHKESARGEAIAAIFTDLGIPVQVQGNTLCVQGVSALRDRKTLSCYADHRIAMMNALLALRSPRGFLLEGADAVKKSFPEFFSYLQTGSSGR